MCKRGARLRSFFVLSIRYEKLDHKIHSDGSPNNRFIY